MPISFPGLFGDWSFNPDPIAVHIGHGIYWYGIILAIGLLAGLVLCMKQAKRYGLTEDNVLDMVLWAVPSCIIGARLYYVIFYLDLYRNADGSLDLLACLDIHRGGLAIYGGIIAGVLIAWAVARYKKIPFPALADVCAFGLLIGQIAGRWGNFLNVEAYGGPTVHPTFLYESLWNLIGFCLLCWLLHKGIRAFDGMYFLLYVAWYGLGRGFIEGLRTDSLYFFSTGIRTSQMLAFLSCAAAIVLLVWKLRTHPKPEDLYVNRIPKQAPIQMDQEIPPETKGE